jgi:signal transduction histidine kinase
MEAIGQLAAGIAHEINTPTQYVTDNVDFLSRAFERLGDLVGASRGLLEGARAGKIHPDVMAHAEACFAKARVDYLMRETPRALDQATEGLHRVAKIVAAMKDFSHPSSGEMGPVDLGEAIQATIMVATSEWKYVADIETKFDPTLPPVTCLRDEISQVVLNLIVNAAHAIDAVVDGGVNGKGTIRIETINEGSWAQIRISDTGAGIPENEQRRVFDPFFTTKPVGKGTGQGLAIAHAVIVGKHQGEISFETAVGKGTTFVIRIPINVKEEHPSMSFEPSRQLA